MCTFSAPEHISIFLVSQFQSCLPISSPVFSRLYKHLEETCRQLPIATKLQDMFMVIDSENSCYAMWLEEFFNHP